MKGREKLIYEKPKIIESIVSEEYETKEFRKKNIEPFRYFSKTQFREYTKKNSYMIIGDVKVNQKRFRDIATSNNPNKLIRKKDRKKIIGTAKILLQSGTVNKSGQYIEAYKSYDIFEARQYRHCIGYAYTGSNRFVRLVKPNFLFLLIFLFLIGLIAGLLSSCPKSPDEIIKWAENKPIEETTAEIQQQPPNCDFVLFTETTELNAENKTIRLINLPSNKGLYDIDYSVYINGEPLLDKGGSNYTTGRIIPGNMVEVNLYDALPAGEYLLVCKATEYYSGGGDELPGKYDLSTILIVNK